MNMTTCRIVLNAEGQLGELANAPLHQPDPNTAIFAALPDGTEGGKPSIAVICQLADGSHVFLEQTMANFIKVAVAFAARYPEAWRAEGVTLEVTPFPPGRE